jgi:hypothetical protein
MLLAVPGAIFTELYIVKIDLFYHVFSLYITDLDKQELFYFK